MPAVVCLLAGSACFAQHPSIRNNYVAASSLPRLEIERAMIYRPAGGRWMYSHHPSITRFKSFFVAMWSNGLKDEDAPGQRVVFSVSKDFIHWSPPAPLATPSAYSGDTLHVLTAAGFHQYGDTLTAYYGEYSPHKTDTHLWAKRSTDGIYWSEAIDMHLPVNPNHGPQATASGRLIISGNFTFPYTDDRSGLSGWKLSSFYPDSLYKEDNPATFYKPAETMDLPPLCEGSFYQTADGILHTLLRVTGKGWKGRLWLSESSDDGKSWSRPAETLFTDNDSKFHFGRLPDGRFYYVGIPDTLHHYARTPLVVAVSQNGYLFDKQYIVAAGPYTLQQEGLWKGGQYGYPHTMVYKNHLYIIISRQKEAVEIIRLAIKQLKE